MTDSAAPLSIGFDVAASTRVDVAAWEALSAEVLAEITADGIDLGLFADTMREMHFRDRGGAAWAYDGRRWWRWDGAMWIEGRPMGELQPQAFTMELLAAPEPDEEPDADVDADVDGEEVGEAYIATNLVPPEGLPAWLAPDPSFPPAAHLAAGLDVMAVTWREDGWAQIRCANDWTAWVDGRRLLPPG